VGPSGTAEARGDKAKAPPAPAAKAEPKKAEPKEDYAGFIVKAAEAAVKERKYPLAISLWQGVVAMRGDEDDAMWRLAEAWTLAGDFDSAGAVLERYAAASGEPAKKQKAQEEAAALAKRERGFSTNRISLVPATKEATQAFKLGRAAFKKKKFDLAVIYFKAGIEMAPEMPGNYRELGESLDKLGRAKEADEFFIRYLRRRPFGKNADSVRPRLVKAKLVGKVTVESALPCDQVWMGPEKSLDGQLVPQRLPLKEQVVAPGRYRVLCFSEKFHHAQNEYIEVKAGDAGKVTFNWAIIENRLTPWARVVIENPYDKSQMNDVGLWEEVGVPIPPDRRALKVEITAGDKSKSKTELVKLSPGQRYVLKW
jgi:tetratricopeptide (TPR) repeat protein